MNTVYKDLREQFEADETYAGSDVLAAILNAIKVSVISSVGSQNLVTLIFTKTTFCQRGNTKRMGHILSISRSSRPMRTPLKSINHPSKYPIYEMYHYFGAHFTEIGCFAMKKMLKMS